jgi:uncharacterized protein YidB (DUF937 family)
MGFLDNLLQGNNNLFSGENLSKPLGIAAMALMTYRASQSRGTAAGGGGLLGEILGATGQSSSVMPNSDQVQGAVPAGLKGLVQRFQQNGLGDAIQSWIGTGQNQSIAPDQVHQALGSDTIDELSRQTGTPRSDLLSELAQALPAFVDHMTPSGRVPNEPEVSQSMNKPIEV